MKNSTHATAKPCPVFKVHEVYKCNVEPNLSQAFLILNAKEDTVTVTSS